MQVVILTTNTDSERQVRYLGPYQIAWWLRTNGFSTQVLEFLYFMTKEERLCLFKKFITHETKVVGYSPFCMLNSQQRLDHGEQLIFDILNEIKDNFPWVKIVAGGQWVRNFLNYAHKKINFKLDGIFTGEAEQSFLEYCNHIFKGTPAPTFTLGPGLNKIYSTTTVYNIQSCNMIFAKNDFILPGESLPLEFSRGCIFKCKFCQYPHIGKDKDDFNKDMSNIRDSLISNYEKFGTTAYHITDDTLNSHRERTKQFYAMTKELPFKIEFIGYVRMDLISIWPEQLEILPESGLISCHFGIESFDPLSCKIIGKGWGAKNHKPFLTYIGKEWGDDVIVRTSMIAGLGKETEKDWKEANEWFLASKVHDWFWGPLHLIPKLGLSEFEKNPEKYGYRFNSNNGDWETDYVTKQQAREWCKKQWNETRSIRIPSAWDYSSLRNLGFSKDYLLKTNYKDSYNDRVSMNLSNKMVQSYYKMAMEY
jgi:radical SAM superfamily enzyme YgiQ (UPF0313 family)